MIKIIDYFNVHSWKEANIAELKRVLVFTSIGESVHARHFECGTPLNEQSVLNFKNKDEKKSVESGKHSNKKRT